MYFSFILKTLLLSHSRWSTGETLGTKAVSLEGSQVRSVSRRADLAFVPLPWGFSLPGWFKQRGCEPGYPAVTFRSYSQSICLRPQQLIQIYRSKVPTQTPCLLKTSQNPSLFYQIIRINRLRAAISPVSVMEDLVWFRVSLPLDSN